MEVHPPTHLNVAYGPHKRNILNLWLVKSDKPTPLVIRIHGGGFMSGGPTPPVMLEEYLKAGISIILSYVGVKMLISDVYKVPTGLSLSIVVGILTLSVLLSILIKEKEEAP
jgi:hypothetical protein